MTDPGSMRSRLIEELELQVERGVSQQQIATSANLPAQYLSDLKTGRRPLTELTARRLASVFGVNFEWLLGESNLRELSSLSSEGCAPTEGTIWIPCFPWPIEGEPRLHPKWDGRSVEISGAAAARASAAVWPYVFQFGVNDVNGRLRQNDLILISQDKKLSAEIVVLKSGGKFFLARQSSEGQLTRLADGKVSNNYSIVGNCLGIVWASLL